MLDKRDVCDPCRTRHYDGNCFMFEQRLSVLACVVRRLFSGQSLDSEPKRLAHTHPDHVSALQAMTMLIVGRVQGERQDAGLWILGQVAPERA